VGERLDPPFIVSSGRRMMSMGLVVVRAIIVIVPLIASFMLSTISFLAPVLALRMKLKLETRAKAIVSDLKK
jgi:hypothetical protein